jgi:hypothetical protein
MDEHQRRLLVDMQSQVRQFRGGELAVDLLAKNLYDISQAPDFATSALWEQFYDLWLPIDGEAELRTEPWAPPGLASDKTLNRALDAFVRWTAVQLAQEDDRRA